MRIKLSWVAYPTFSSLEEEDGGTREGRGREDIALVGFKKTFQMYFMAYRFRLEQVQNIFHFALPLWETTDKRCLNFFCLGAPTTSPYAPLKLQYHKALTHGPLPWSIHILNTLSDKY
jgi:hypothetical protein